MGNKSCLPLQSLETEKMGKKSGSSEKGKVAKAFVLKVAMHCQCNGCIDKIGSAIKDLALVPGVEGMDQSAVESKGEVKLVATADPEELRRRLHKATGKKNVVLVMPKEEPAKANNKKDDSAAAAPYLSAQYGHGAWADQLGGGWNTGSYGPSAASSSPYAYPAASAPPWPNAYPPPTQGHGAYDGAPPPAWHTHGY